jgi:hypothetical protein
MLAEQFLPHMPCRRLDKFLAPSQVLVFGGMATFLLKSAGAGAAFV